MPRIISPSHPPANGGTYPSTPVREKLLSSAPEVVITQSMCNASGSDKRWEITLEVVQGVDSCERGDHISN